MSEKHNEKIQNVFRKLKNFLNDNRNREDIDEEEASKLLNELFSLKDELRSLGVSENDIVTFIHFGIIREKLEMSDKQFIITKKEFIPYYMCQECNMIYRADDLSALPSDWEKLIELYKCRNCDTINLDTINFIKICPFETYQPKIKESRCIIPMGMSEKATYGHNGSWFCEFHGRIEECPTFAIFSGIKKRE